MKHPIHPFGTYFLHGDGRPRLVKILEVGANAQVGKVKIEDHGPQGHSVYWIGAQHLSRSPKPAPRPPAPPMVGRPFRKFR